MTKPPPAPQRANFHDKPQASPLTTNKAPPRPEPPDRAEMHVTGHEATNGTAMPTLTDLRRRIGRCIARRCMAHNTIGVNKNEKREAPGA
jgi:hypothetical protein